MTESNPTHDAGELLDALRAVLEAIDIDPGATVADGEISDRILIERVGHAKVMLQGILRRDAGVDVPWSVGYLRARLAEHPAAGFKTWAERGAELEAAKAASAGAGC